MRRDLRVDWFLAGMAAGQFRATRGPLVVRREDRRQTRDNRTSQLRFSGSKHRRLIPVARSFQSIIHNLLRLGDDGVEVRLIFETLRINLVDVFRAGWSGGEPSAGGDHLQTANWRVISWCAGELRGDR